ncbi:MAG: hypothetical protein ACOC6F_02935 [bacterium]
MACREKVLEGLDSVEYRRDERKSLWKAIMDSFEDEGADGVTTELAGQLDRVRREFEAAVEKLNNML